MVVSEAKPSLDLKDYISRNKNKHGWLPSRPVVSYHDRVMGLIKAIWSPCGLDSNERSLQHCRRFKRSNHSE